jgi:ribosomal protein L37AE/L43A
MVQSSLIESGDYPMTGCPRCGRLTVDMDGFGVLHCIACGYCTHASQSGDEAGLFRCDFCGKVFAPPSLSSLPKNFWECG